MSIQDKPALSPPDDDDDDDEDDAGIDGVEDDDAAAVALADDETASEFVDDHSDVELLPPATGASTDMPRMLALSIELSG